jgi:superfamily II DNA/RNA helicase
LSKKEGLKNW